MWVDCRGDEQVVPMMGNSVLAVASETVERTHATPTRLLLRCLTIVDTECDTPMHKYANVDQLPHPWCLLFCLAAGALYWLLYALLRSSGRD